jgi:uncharacterized protein (UPF0332 family)
VIEDARLHLDLADEMLAEATAALDRGAHRTAVDRAYYAMVHAASALLAADGEQAASHGRLIVRLGEQFARPGRIDRRHHRAMIAAYELRHAADYDPRAKLDGADVLDTVDGARAFVTAASDFLATP